MYRNKSDVNIESVALDFKALKKKKFPGWLVIKLFQ